MILGGPDAFDVSSNNNPLRLSNNLADLFGSMYEGQDDGDVVYDADAEEAKKKGMRNRYFSKMEKGSVRGSILGMTCAAIGSGVLTFPNVFKQIGWVNGIVLLAMGAFGCWWSLYMLI